MVRYFGLWKSYSTQTRAGSPIGKMNIVENCAKMMTKVEINEMKFASQKNFLK